MKAVALPRYLKAISVLSLSLFLVITALAWGLLNQNTAATYWLMAMSVLLGAVAWGSSLALLWRLCRDWAEQTILVFGYAIALIPIGIWALFCLTALLFRNWPQ